MRRGLLFAALMLAGRIASAQTHDQRARGASPRLRRGVTGADFPGLDRRAEALVPQAGGAR